MKVLPRSFYNRNTKTVAKELLGKYLIQKLGKKRLIGKIVETEAYFENDPASHSYRGKTSRNAPMFEKPGYAYVYFIYGNHYCLNFVTEKEGKSGAVLIRAIEPISGIEIMKKNRKKKELHNLTNGPGKLAQAFKIDRIFNRADLNKGNLVVMKVKNEHFKTVKSGRIGLSVASDKHYRYYIKDNHFVSKFRG